jgi:hypothetical protein
MNAFLRFIDWGHDNPWPFSALCCCVGLALGIVFAVLLP